RAGNIKIEYVFSPLYKTTNNIYSLWMARKIINEPFVLIESDLVFDPSLLTDMLYPDRIAIARMKPWLDGSTVTINSANTVDAFHGDAKNNSKQTRYKTVNIYSLSVSSWHRVIEKLDQYILAGRVNDYYEAVFRQMVIEKSLSFQAVFFDHKPWCEIDTIKDLESAEKLFPARISKPLSVYDIEPDRLKNSELYARKPLVTGSIYVRSSL
ncbi:MAG: phosphocholine cytidylyltransferase family protein, partial [Deltaproteobacteria bacterium]|nr:phosphocholine cytidylyltransferase family protein [Deltaproteobacteria bacterium]